MAVNEFGLLIKCACSLSPDEDPCDEILHYILALTTCLQNDN